MTIRLVPDQRYKIGVLCTHGLFSDAVIRALISCELTPRIIVFPGIKLPPTTLETSPRLVVSNNKSRPDDELISLLKSHQIRYSYSQLLEPQSLIDELFVDDINLLLVACFPYKIPPAIYQTFCCLNIHPSLLPSYKGPSPLFWQLRHNHATLGVSLHYLSEQWDSGEILTQKAFVREPGADEYTLISQAAEVAKDLLLEALRGRTQSVDSSVSHGSYFRAPEDQDFCITPDWEVQHAYDFLRGTQSWQHNYRFQARDGSVFYLRDAIEAVAGLNMERPYLKIHNQVQLQLKDGTITANLAPV